MAAYAALVSLDKLINQILVSHDQDYTFLCNKHQMNSLHENVIRLQEFLENRSTIAALETRIRNVAYRLDYIIESVICNLFPHPRNSFSRMLASSMSCIRRHNGEAGLLFSSCIDEIDTILEEATNVPVTKHTSATLRSSTSSLSTAPIAKANDVGMNNQIAQILETITGRASGLQIVPVTGMGGIGKTTLARAVYDDSRTRHHFDVRFWVTISQEYNTQEILRRLLPTEKQEKLPDDRLIEHVYKNLKGQRFLIVLDDMWHGKAWDSIMNAFPDDKKGSRIILTTRELGVASYVGSLSNVHEMQLLNEDQSWIMLRENVYGEEPCPAELGDIGRTISKNCKGLPLAIVVISGLLKRNKMKDYWEEVAENTNAAAAADYDHLHGILSLSYTNLPPQLKACFLYVGAFPEDYEFRSKQILMLWAAEGFIKPRESLTMEETAQECMQELVDRSLILVKTKTYDGKIKTFSIHDIMREVSLRNAKEEKFLFHHSTSPVQNIINNRPRKSFYKKDFVNFQSHTYIAHVRSLRYEVSIGLRYLWEILLWITSVNQSVENSLGGANMCRITSLRYLNVVDIDMSGVIIFPKSIYKLQNLETLIISSQYGTEMCVFPLDIWKLPRLRHFIVDIVNCDSQFPRLDIHCGGYPVLESLQTLWGVMNINLIMDVVERIPNVKKLGLVYEGGSLDYWQKFSLSNLQHLHQLEVLSLRCSKSRDDFGLPPPNDIAFPQNLTKVKLFGTRIPLESEYMSVVGLLPSLEVLKLMELSIVGNIWEPVEGEFPQLKYLKMDSLCIQEWIAESVHFPCLERLEIRNCKDLKEVPESIGEIETLLQLVLKRCSRTKESLLKIQENQQAFGNDSLIIITEDDDS